uniref:Ubiquitin-like protease family profile domain-containing protein n=1 Tax=Knipowitschia caucasica TaxID=637954 RepID=A0AAV2IVG5_KNICA
MLKRPTKTPSQEELSVDIKEKWEKQIIAEGICEELRAPNPFCQDTLSIFCPWIGPQTRCGNVIPHTEMLKGVGGKTNEEGSKCTSVNEDQILSLLESKKVKKSELIKACSDLGLSSEGSEVDLINRLEEMLLYKDIYPKMFLKLQKTGDKKIKEKMESQTEESLHINQDGQLVLGSLEPLPAFTMEKMDVRTEQREQRNGFSLSLFPIDPTLQKKLENIYKGPVTDYAILKLDQAFVYRADLLSLCPEELLTEDACSAPWLTDYVVNAQVLQLAKQKENVFALKTYNYTAWWRNSINGEDISSRHLKCIQTLKEDSIVLFPRIVGHSTPETGDHFILWAFNGSTKEISIFDSLAQHTRISDQEMQILRQGFANVWNLEEWAVLYPPQWRQKDSVNCGVFVCTTAELYIRGEEQMIRSEAQTYAQDRPSPFPFSI